MPRRQRDRPGSNPGGRTNYSCRHRLSDTGRLVLNQRSGVRLPVAAPIFFALVAQMGQEQRPFKAWVEGTQSSRRTTFEQRHRTVRWPGNRLEEVRDSKAVDRESACAPRRSSKPHDSCNAKQPKGSASRYQGEVAA